MFRSIVTLFGVICPGHHARAGCRIPPSYVVAFPQRNGPLLPPGGQSHKITKITKLTIDLFTWLGLMCPGHQASAGCLIPPSNVVCFPQRKGPLLPPGGKQSTQRLRVCSHERLRLRCLWHNSIQTVRKTKVPRMK